ncbi:MAG: hypothetical protein IJ870_00665 [Alphaproteobacteria bacterium]|nr:hypothetical protein [Alphaproteobacteria bacterium]
MAMMMVFSSKQQSEKYESEAVRLGLKCFQTDNIYQFLRYAKEVRPDVAMMEFEEGFNQDEKMMESVKEALCEKDKCARLYINRVEKYLN